MFWSDGRGERLELGQGEVKEILLMHMGRPRGGFCEGGGSRDRSSSWSGSGC